MSINHQDGGSVWLVSVDHQDGGSDKWSEEMVIIDGQGGQSDG